MSGPEIRLVLISEGSSEAPLIGIIEALCLRAGARDVLGIWPDLSRLPRPPGKRVVDQLRAALKLEPAANLIAIHRDSDAEDDTPRRVEIAAAVQSVGLEGRVHVAVVPVQELEAWLLLDEAGIRAVAGKPSGRVALSLPRPRNVEGVPDPKKLLHDAILAASGATGRRQGRLSTAAELGRCRRQLLERLDLDGPINEVPSFKRLIVDLNAAVEALAPPF